MAPILVHSTHEYLLNVAFGVVLLKQVMAPKQPNTGLFVGLNKGHVVTRKELAPRPSDRKGVR